MTNIPVFLSADNNYAPFVATTMASILDNTKSFIEFYVLDGGITKVNREKIISLNFNNFSVEFLEIDFDKYFKDFKETPNITKSMYSRFLIPYLKPSINKAIYSDVDVVFLDDVKKMYDEELDDYALGAVFEEFAEGDVNYAKRKRTNISAKHKYFSSGNLIIDCKKWREQNILDKLLQIGHEYQDSLVEPDMDILNKFFDSNYKILPPKYCWINQNYEFFEQSAEPIIIRHFNGHVKPWHIHPDINENKMLPFTLDKNRFWHYAQMTPFYDILIERVNYRTDRDLQKFLVLKLMQKRNNETAR